ncbi:MAG: protein kinase [Xanthomonadales bacterium]|nr:protein kinase [Xanthomonadales bacterium]
MGSWSDQAISQLVSLAFAGAAPGERDGFDLAFRRSDELELDLSDPEQRDLGDYELLERLGQGGMGVVYLAHQRSLDRQVALKLLSAGPWAAPDFIVRFQREAQSAARLQHANIVPIYEIGEFSELNYFSMGLVRGRSLAEIIEQEGPRSPEQAARLVRTIAEALDYAHRLSILHLDLKPANVLIDANGEPQVADFGLARRLDESLSGDGGVIAGTPCYMAPEQATGEDRKIGVATDIYGLGALLYELLCGRPPCLAATAQLTLEQVARGQWLSPRVHNPAIPADLVAICEHCLAARGEQRYSSARALAEDLGRFLEGREVSVRPLHFAQRTGRWARREPRLAMALVALLLSLSIGLFSAGVQWRRAESHAEQARTNLWLARSEAAQAALTQGDGFRGLQSLVANLREMEAQGRDEQAALERQRIGIALQNAPALIDLLRLPDGESGSALAISPDATSFAVATYKPGGSRMVRLYDLEHRRQRWALSTDDLTHGLPFANHTIHGELVYSADGAMVLAYLTQSTPFAAPTRSDAIALSVASGLPQLPEPRPQKFSDMVFSDDAGTALVRRRSEQSLRFADRGRLYSTDQWQPLGPERELGPYMEWLPSPDGRRLLATADFCNLDLLALPDWKLIWQLQLRCEDPVRAWRFSPDGTQLALGSNLGSISLVSSADGSLRPLPTTLSARVNWLEYNADGETLAARAIDGSLMAWDSASGLARMAPFRSDALASSNRLRLAGQSLYAVGDNALLSMHLVPPSPFNLEPVVESARPRHGRHMHSSGFDLHPDSRLMITTGADGLVAIWRLPPAVVQTHRAAPLAPRTPRFDGVQLVAVDHNRVQLVSLDGADARSPELVHPQPIRFAELSADGRYLVTIAARTVRVFRAGSGELVGSPILLPQSPLRAELAAQAPLLAVTTAEYHGNQYRERAHLIDLPQSRLRQLEMFADGGWDGFALDPRGTAIVRLHSGQESFTGVELVATDAAAPRCGRLELSPGDSVLDLSFAPSGENAWLFINHAAGGGQLSRWNLRTCALELRMEQFRRSGEVRLAAGDHGVVANHLAPEAVVSIDGQGRQRWAPGVLPSASLAAFAVSADGQRAAVASRNAVQIVDLVRGERLSAELAAPIAGNDALIKLVFDPSGLQLLGRSARGRWLRWPLGISDEPLSELQAMADVLDPVRGSNGALESAQKLTERFANAGLHPAQAFRSGAGYPAAVLEEPIDHGIAARMIPLDLRAAINAPLDDRWPIVPGPGGDLASLSLGLHRFNDVDWQISGAIQLNGGGPATYFGSPLPESAPIPIPSVHATRIHLLMRTQIPIPPGAPRRLAAEVRLLDQAGLVRVLPILTQRDVVPSGFNAEAGAEPGIRIAWRGTSLAWVRAGVSSDNLDDAVFAVTLDVPAEMAELQSLTLKIGNGQMEAPVFYAVTLETVE